MGECSKDKDGRDSGGSMSRALGENGDIEDPVSGPV